MEDENKDQVSDITEQEISPIEEATPPAVVKWLNRYMREISELDELRQRRLTEEEQIGFGELLSTSLLLEEFLRHLGQGDLVDDIIEGKR